MPDLPKLLAIESSCDETAVAVTCGRTVLSSVVLSQIDTHRRFGGVVPEIASRCHVQAVAPLTKQALAEAGLALADVDALAVTHSPGLIGALLVGLNYAKGLCLSLNKPLVPVHHLRSHIASNYITHPDLTPPFLCLIVSGGHTHLVEVLDYTRFRVAGRTRDDAAGECFDKVARAMGLPYPGGVHLDRVAADYQGEASFVLPVPRVEGNDLDFSFSGLKTAVINLLHRAEQRGESVEVPALCATVRRQVCDILADRTLLAAERLGYKTVAVCGGVSANRLLRAELAARCEAVGMDFYVPDLSLCGDNAAMVGVQGYYEWQAGHTAGMDLNAAATMAIDEVFD